MKTPQLTTCLMIKNGKIFLLDKNNTRIQLLPHLFNIILKVVTTRGKMAAE